MFTAFPLLAVPVVIYNLFVLTLNGGFRSVVAQETLGKVLFDVGMPAGVWSVNLGDLLLAGSLVVLFIELLKSTTSRRAAIVNQSLSLVLFILCLVEFLLSPAFATSTFFLIALMVLLDVMAGVVISIVSARRDIELEH